MPDHHLGPRLHGGEADLFVPALQEFVMCVELGDLLTREGEPLPKLPLQYILEPRRNRHALHWRAEAQVHVEDSDRCWSDAWNPAGLAQGPGPHAFELL